MFERETTDHWMARARVTLLTRDTMPKEVALEMLARPGVRMTNRERKTYRDALTRYYVSTLERKPREDKFAFKLTCSTWAQLNKWQTRVSRRYSDLQKKYSLKSEEHPKMEEGPDKIFAGRELIAMQVVGTSLQQILEVLENEIDARAAKASAADKVKTEEVSV